MFFPLQNWRVIQGTGSTWRWGGGCRRMNMVQIIHTHVYKGKNSTRYVWRGDEREQGRGKF
jgi:hypothetical protein